MLYLPALRVVQVLQNTMPAFHWANGVFARVSEIEGRGTAEQPRL